MYPGASSSSSYTSSFSFWITGSSSTTSFIYILNSSAGSFRLACYEAAATLFLNFSTAPANLLARPVTPLFHLSSSASSLSPSTYFYCYTYMCCSANLISLLISVTYGKSSRRHRRVECGGTDGRGVTAVSFKV